MEENKKIALIFCSGESIHNNYKVIPKLIKKFSKNVNPNLTSCGINLFTYKFIEVYQPTYKNKSVPIDYWMFSDDATVEYVLNNYDGQKLIVNKYIDNEKLNLLNKNCNVDYLFGHTDKVTKEINNNNLYGIHSTPLKSIHLFLSRGYEVVVFGMDNKIDENGNFKHFYPEIKVNKKDFYELIDIRYQLNELTKIGKIYKVDKENNIDLPLIDLDFLLEGKILEVKNEQKEFLDDNEKITLNADKLISLKIPKSSPEDGSIFLESYEYKIENRIIKVIPKHVELLINQGFKIHE